MENSVISQYISKAKNIINEEKYSWDYLTKTETNAQIIKNQFNKYTEAIEYLLKVNKENNLKNSKEMSHQIETYLKKAEFLKLKLSELESLSTSSNMNNSMQNTNINLSIDKNMNNSASTNIIESPLWEKDENAPMCNGCKGKFSLFNRRHHCRYCGKVFCSKCSDYQFNIKQDSPALRVCKFCYKKLMKDKINAVDRNIAIVSENEDSFNSSDDELIECPVCGKSFSSCGSYSNNIENHLKTCLENENEVKLGNRYELQNLDYDLEKECPICFEEFLKGQTIVRIDCLCIFHKECIDKWYDYRKVDGICPIHSLND